MRAKYVLAEVMVGLWRNVTMTIAMILTMAVSLTLLGVSLLAVWKVDDMKEYFHHNVEVSIFLKKDATQDQRDGLRDLLKKDDLVASASYESKEVAYQRFKQQFKDVPELINSTPPDAIPDSYRIKLKDSEKTDQLIAGYRDKPGVDTIVDQRKLLDKLFKFIVGGQKLALGFAALVGLAALLLVGNTIQVAAYSKRREVSIMRLVGASNWFIQAPFVLEAAFAGVIGAVLAWLMLVVGKIFVLDSATKSIASLISPFQWGDIWMMLPLLAAVAGVVNAIVGWITLRFYIKV
ncbi:permease-like cell division protein FtsX [Longispora albida]|uniref:permease-like cell division protein FtsX n=1 Tax=Longispora albida TaxID=203523 RepID=UPI0003758D5B|nr:permease-like cell division protein FtsX [Longispora albida]